MASSVRKKKITNMVYGLGASIVIIGALFKIQHLSIGPLTGGVMLTIGLLVEAAIFAMSAFEPVDDELDWTKVYPELGEAGIASERELGTDGMLSQKLDALLQEANIDSELMSNLGSSMKNLQGAAEGLSAASESISSTSKYNEQMSLAATQMESLNNLYQVQVQNATQQSEFNTAVVEKGEKLKEQMDSLANNLSSLNGVYGGMLSAMSKS